MEQEKIEHVECKCCRYCQKECGVTMHEPCDNKDFN